MASLTKPIATATSVLVLVDRGKLALDQPIARVLPAFENHGKGPITVEQLLRHRAGLIPDNPLSDYENGPDAAWKALAELGLVHPPGSTFVYSDVGYEILGRLIQQVSGEPLDAFARREVFEPLGMSDTRFHLLGGVLDADRLSRSAATEKEAGQWLKGTVHDPRARALGGVAGHAGMFGTADDLARYAAALLASARGDDGGARWILSRGMTEAMIGPGTTPRGQERGLGWDIGTGYNAPRGRLFGPRSFGHTGFTGTSIWIDPETNTFVIVLASRLHPDGQGPSLNALRSEIGTIVAEAIVDEPFGGVRPGIDVLAESGFAPLVGKRVGLVTNPTGRNRAGKSTIDVLRAAPGVTLAALFSPEHGLRAELDQAIEDGREPATGLPVYSLYGVVRKPTAESLAELDALVFDIQDIGTRFYTYISTLGYCLEAASERKIPLVVLDRPNPLGGLQVSGPLRDDAYASFIAYHALPVVHGMTVGELGRLFNAERAIGAELIVIPCAGWHRAQSYEATGLLWVNPSPNMRSLTQARLYPGIGLLESTNLATGRGTDTPFERVGAPWIDPVAWAEALRRQALPGLRVTPIRFTPTARQYAGQSCGGVQLEIVDAESFRPMNLAFGFASTLRALYPEQWEAEGFRQMLADDSSNQAFREVRPFSEIEASWNAELQEFRVLRDRYLLYP
jgi:uncharacterized protein YbbC (DUF1343 family)